MIRKHRILFKLWKFKMMLLGIKEGTTFYTWSDEKGKYIRGVVTSLSGESINNEKYGFDIGINWHEPIQGFDTRYYTWGSYSYQQTKEMLTRNPANQRDETAN